MLISLTETIGYNGIEQLLTFERKLSPSTRYTDVKIRKSKQSTRPYIFAMHTCGRLHSRMRIIAYIFSMFAQILHAHCYIHARTCTNGSVYIQHAMAARVSFGSVTGLLRTTQYLLRRNVCTGVCSQQQTDGKSEEKIRDGNGMVSLLGLL